MKKMLLLLGLILALCVTGTASAYQYGPALQGSYKNVTVSVTSVTSTIGKNVAGATSDRSLAILTNVGATYDLYWAEVAGTNTYTAATWHKLPAGKDALILTCNFAPGTWGKTNYGIAVRVTPTPWTEAMADFRSYILFR